MPVTYQLNISGPTGNFSFNDTITMIFDTTFFTNYPAYHYLESGKVIVEITDTTFDFSVSGTYYYTLIAKYPGDTLAANDTLIDSLVIKTPSMFTQKVDFTNYNGNNLNSLFPLWFEGNGTNEDFPEDLIANAQTSLWGGAYAKAWKNDNTHPYGTCATFYQNATEHNDWILSAPVEIPADTQAVLTFDLAMLDYLSTAFSGLQGLQSFSVGIAPDCGNFFYYDTAQGYRFFNILKTYDSLALVNNPSLLSLLQQGFTDTISLKDYAGQSVRIGFYAQGKTNTPMEIFLDNINISAPLPDFQALQVNHKDTACFGSTENFTFSYTNAGQGQGTPTIQVIYANQNVSYQGATLNPGDSDTLTIPVLLNSPGNMQITFVVSNAYDTLKNNDTITAQIYVFKDSLLLSASKDTLLVPGDTLCVFASNGICDSISWNIPSVLSVVSGGGSQDSFVCVTTNFLQDTTVTIFATKSCKGCASSATYDISLKNIKDLAVVGFWNLPDTTCLPPDSTLNFGVIIKNVGGIPVNSYNVSVGSGNTVIDYGSMPALQPQQTDTFFAVIQGRDLPHTASTLTASISLYPPDQNPANNSYSQGIYAYASNIDILGFPFLDTIRTYEVNEVVSNIDSIVWVVNYPLQLVAKGGYHDSLAVIRPHPNFQSYATVYLYVRYYNKGCYAEATREIVVSPFTGINTLSQANIKVYPTLFKHFFYVEIPNGIPYQLLVRDLQGREVFKKKLLKSATINTETWASGMYIVEFTATEGKRYYAKIVKE